MPVSPGEMIGHYRIVERIGEGGMGVVWKAQDTVLGREVALKVLPERVASDERNVRQLRDEARILASLNHPNIVTVYAIEEAGGHLFFTMELVGGTTLDRRLNREGLPLSQILGLAISIVRTLAAAHEHGVTHRDLKPANVMVDEQGKVTILDFGLAKVCNGASLPGMATDLTATVTSNGAVLGTLSYMPPEQLQGRPADHRADIFSVGVILYHMATGRLPFGGETAAEVVSSTLRDAPVAITAINPALPSRLGGIVGRCLEKSPADRYQRTDELLRDLESLARDTGAEGEAEDLPSIAVLPFADMSPQKDQDYFCEGMAEEIINALTRIAGLHVASRTSSFLFKETAADSREIGRRLGVRTFLEGSVRKAGKRLRITAQLINAADGYHLWSERYDRDLEDVFAIQDEIAGAIVEILEVKLLGAERSAARSRARNLEAYSLNLKGRYFWNKRTEEGLRKGIDYFERAIAREPGYAGAHASLADSYALLCSYHLLSPAESIPRAREAAARALELDPSLAEAHEALGHINFLHDWDWPGAESEYRRAIELNLGFATAHQRLALLHGLAGRFQESEASIRRAQRLDPLSLIINTDVALVHYVAGRHAEAERQCRAVLEMSSHFGVARFVLGLVQERLGRYDESIAELEEAMRISGAQTVMLGALGHAYGAAGRSAEAQGVLNRLRDLSSERFVSPYSVATVHAGLGEKGQALQQLEEALAQRSVWLVHLPMGVDPRLEDLRGDSRFAAILARMNLS